MQQGALRRNGISSSKVIRRALIDIFQEWLLEKRKRIELFNGRCELGRLEREKTWNKWKKKGGTNLWEKYKNN